MKKIIFIDSEKQEVVEKEVSEYSFKEILRACRNGHAGSGNSRLTLDSGQHALR